MNKITAEEFKAFINQDPSWCKTLTEPTEITTYCNMMGSNITHLSPLLTFSGRDEYGVVASFSHCENLRIATGTYHGFVSFFSSGVEEIRDLVISAPDTNGYAASFYTCKNLRVASGTYPGFVDFSQSGVEEIKDLVVSTPDVDGDAASFYGCKNLRVVTGNYSGRVDFSYSGVSEFKDLVVSTVGSH
jgi:hypothetical protein